MAKKGTQATSKKNVFVIEGRRVDELEPGTKLPEPRLRKFYSEKVVPALMQKFGSKTVMQVPKIEKIVINMGIGAASQDPKLLQSAINELEMITGQRPVIRRAKKAISNFKLREGMGVGVSVTLRNAKMYEFLDRFINIAAPRIRDFRGFPDKSFDGRGNYTFGIKEQIIFPEIDVDKVGRISGMDVTFVTTAATDEQAYALISEFGFPFRKNRN